jgi:GntR family transcriptional regulator
VSLPPRRPSLVDSAEEALRAWLVPGRHRPGDRLPPEHDLAGMLGVSRGTLRTALERLAASGEIVRRQGSGTFVGHPVRPAVFDEGLEHLESYTSLARRQGVRLAVSDLRAEPLPADPATAAALDLPAGTPALTVTRVVLADGRPAAHMVDVIHPSLPVAGEAALLEALERGDMMLDVLVAAGVPVAFASTRVEPRLLRPREPEARALGLGRSTATLELDETMHLADGTPVQHSRDLFAPEGLHLHVIRWLERPAPPSVGHR